MESPLCFEETNVFPVSHMFARIFFRVELSEQIFFFEGTRFLRGVKIFEQMLLSFF